MTLIVASKDKVKILLDLKDKLKSLKHIVIMEDADEALVKQGLDAKIEIISMKNLEKEGEAEPKPANAPGPEDVATYVILQKLKTKKKNWKKILKLSCRICYTSGTTGMPKGVVLTHAHILSFPAAALALCAKGHLYQFVKDDIYVSYLPLAHIYEREVQCVIVYHGARIGFFQGDTLKLLDDVAELKPSLFPSVPRLYNRIYDKVMAGVKAKGGIAKLLFDYAYSSKKACLQNGYTTHWLWDRLVFSKIKARLGGNVKLMLTGAAPISADVMDFLRIAFGADVHEGYGQTETCAAISVVRI